MSTFFPHSYSYFPSISIKPERFAERKDTIHKRPKNFSSFVCFMPHSLVDSTYAPTLAFVFKKSSTNHIFAWTECLRVRVISARQTMKITVIVYRKDKRTHIIVHYYQCTKIFMFIQVCR